jgi:hypothetical protein
MKIARFILAKTLGFSKNILDFIAPIFKQQANESIGILLPIALEIVTELANDNKTTPAKKRQLAFSRMTAAVKKESIVATTSIINLCIELALSHFKSIQK